MSKARASDLHVAVRQSLQQAKALLYYGGGRAVTALEQPELILLDQLLGRARELSADLPMQTRAVIEACPRQVHGWGDAHGAFPRVFDHGDVLERLHDNLRGVLTSTKPMTPSGAKAHEQLMQATLSGDLNAMKTAMVAGANINAIRPGPGDSALHQAAAMNHEHAVALLIEAGADPNLQNYRGFTPLHEAAFRDTPAIWNRLIEAGAKDDIPASENGHSPATLRDSLVWGQAMVDQSVAQAQRLAPPREMSMGR